MKTDTTERGFERLICTALTGKLDVREAAANLPDEPDKTETVDEAVEEDLDAAPEEVEA